MNLCEGFACGTAFSNVIVPLHLTWIGAGTSNEETSMSQLSEQKKLFITFDWTHNYFVNVLSRELPVLYMMMMLKLKKGAHK